MKKTACNCNGPGPTCSGNCPGSNNGAPCVNSPSGDAYVIKN